MQTKRVIDGMNHRFHKLRELSELPRRLAMPSGPFPVAPQGHPIPEPDQTVQVASAYAARCLRSLR